MAVGRALRRAVAAGKPLVPARAWGALLSARSLVGEGPVVGMPAMDGAIVVAPHPDDETIGCGGLLALLGRAGVPTSVIFATDGEATRGSPAPPAEVAALRRAEAQRACEVLGVASVSFLHLADGHLDLAGPELTGAIRTAGQGSSGTLLCPWFGDGHPDHTAVTEAVVRSGLADDREVWSYETWTPLPCNRIVDISSVVDVKRRAMDAHATASLAFDIEATLGLNRYRSIHGLMGRGHAEAFLAANLGDYRRLMEASATALGGMSARLGKGHGSGPG
ncbi:MAG: hypothetical protein NVSMB16_10120 [Acidimicrobiales bacterium]